ncbi:MAG: class A beta-lactamase [Thermoanaerobaculia bacterium]
MLPVAAIALITSTARAEEPALEQQVTSIAAQIDGVVGVQAIDLRSGRRLSLNADQAFPMGSVYKFPLAIAVLSEVDRGKLRLDQKLTLEPSDFSRGHSPIRDHSQGKAVTMTLRRLIEAAVADSDNSAADFLMRIAGGPQRATAKIRNLNIEGIRIDRSENEIGGSFDSPGGVASYAIDPRDTATPSAMARLWELVMTNREALRPASHRLLLSVLTRSKNPVRIARLLPGNLVVSHKTGTMPGTLNDTGAVSSRDGRHIIVMAIFTRASSSSAEKRTAVVAEIASAIYQSFTH